MFLKMTSTTIRKNVQDPGQPRRKKANLDLPLRKSRVTTKQNQQPIFSSPLCSIFVDLFLLQIFINDISNQGYWNIVRFHFISPYSNFLLIKLYSCILQKRTTLVFDDGN